LFFADFSNIKVIIALAVAALAIVLLFSAKKIAQKILEKKYSDTESQEYKDKLLNMTLLFKGIAAGITVIACVVSLI
jgi:hypothetical protein